MDDQRQHARVNMLLWNAKRGLNNNLGLAVEHVLEASPEAPAIIGWPEATQYLAEGAEKLYEFRNQLSDALLPAGVRYDVFVTRRVGHKNHPALLVDPRYVEVTHWHEPHVNDTRDVRWGWIQANVGSIRDVWISCDHWTGTKGDAAFEAAACRVAEVSRKSLVLGDLNQTSSWAGEVNVDWHEVTRATPWKRRQKGVYNPITERWELRTKDIDFLRQAGYVDLGELAGDNTPTTNEGGSGLRIDRIIVGPDLRLDLRDYRVHETPIRNGKRISDHRLVTAEVDLWG